MTQLPYLRLPTRNVLRLFLQNISAEPAVVLYGFSNFLFSATMPNLIQQKVCSPHSQPPLNFVCNDTALLAEATDITTLRATLRQVFAAVILIPAGFWRDATGLNKLTIYLALFGEIIGSCIQLYAYLNWTSSAKITSILEGIISGLGGTNKLFMVGASCAVNDNTKSEARTTRFTLITVGEAVGTSLAFAVVGHCITYMGFDWLLVFIILLQLGSGFLIMIFVKDNLSKEKKKLLQSLRELKSVFIKRPNLSVIWMMVLATCLIYIIIGGELNLYQYYLQEAFGYSIDQAGLYISYRCLVNAIGSTVISYLLNNLMKISDFKIGIICSTFAFISCIPMVFADTLLQIKIFALLEITRLVLTGVPKSIISKCLIQNEMGIFLCISYTAHSILIILINYLYDRIYNSTLASLPGAFFLLSAAIIAVLFLLYSISFFFYTPIESREHEEQCNKENIGDFENVHQLPEMWNF